MSYPDTTPAGFTWVGVSTGSYPDATTAAFAWEAQVTAQGFSGTSFGQALAVTETHGIASAFNATGFGAAVSITDTVGTATGFASSAFGTAAAYEFPVAGYSTSQFGQHQLELSAPPWTPALISTRLWLDAADASTFTLAGASVSQWRDKSGNARHVEQSISSSQPAVVAAEQNGRDVVRFDGTNDRLYSASSGTLGSSASELNCFIVRKYAASPTTNGTFFGQYLPGSATFELCRFYRNASGKQAAFFARTTSGATVASSDNAAGWEIVSWHAGLAANEMRMRVGSTSVGTGTIPGSGNTGSGNATFQLGCTAASLDLFAGDIAEVVYVDTLSDANRQKIEGYLAHKWGITATLPADHPYKTDAPVDAFPAAGIHSTAFGQAIAGTDQTLVATSYQSAQFGVHTIVPDGAESIVGIAFVPWSPKSRFGVAQVGFVDQAFAVESMPAARFGAPVGNAPSTEIAAGDPATYHGILSARGFIPSAFGVPVAQYAFTAQASAFQTARFGNPSRVVAQIATRIRSTKFGRAQATVDVVASGIGFKRSRFGRPSSASDRVFSARSLPAPKFGQHQQTALGASGFSRSRFGTPVADYDAHAAYGFCFSRFGHGTMVEGAFSAAGFSDSAFGEPAAQVSHVALHIWPQSRFGQPLLKRAA